VDEAGTAPRLESRIEPSSPDVSAFGPLDPAPDSFASRKHYLTKGVGIVAPIPQMQDPTSRHFWILWAVAFLGFPAAVVAARRSTSCSVQPRE
jgi:hypothetical protein